MSQTWEYIKIALMNIRSNKGRSMLTMLGIIIGISSVIMIISVGNGVKGQVNEELNNMIGGMVELYVSNAGNDNNTDYLEFTMEDLEAVQDKLPKLKGVSPVFSIWGAQATGRRGTFDAQVYGGTESFQYYNKEPIIKGHYFTEGDYYAGNRVCVINQQNAKKLFGTDDVVGMEISLSVYGITQDLTIIGVRKDSDASLISGLMDDGQIQIDIPMSVFGSSYGYYVDTFDDLILFSEESRDTGEIARKAVSVLESRHGVRGKDLIVINDANSEVAEFDTILGGVTAFIVLVAAISLLVGGIGVMNIMLVSVTERTREIGIRKALGARTGSILLQFLSESAIITLLGGLIGIALGVLGAFGICGFLGISPLVKLSTVLGASLFSSAVGIFFGIYPAKKAAKLSPIEALRHE